MTVFVSTLQATTYRYLLQRKKEKLMFMFILQVHCTMIINKTKFND